jgi:hypothetical protein
MTLVGPGSIHNIRRSPNIEPNSLHFRSSRAVGVGSSDLPSNGSGPVRPLQYNLALLAHLVYLARRTQAEQQQRYLEWASDIIDEMQRHPKL